MEQRLPNFDLFDDKQNDFILWRTHNEHIVEAFIKSADRIRATGRANYSAQTIVELLRWETDLREHGSDFKINNNHIADLARLYNERVGYRFFRTRGRK